MKGKFIVLDGIDGCGKTTQARLLKERLEKEGFSVVHIREPGSTGPGERIRGILLSKDTGELHPRTEALLFMAARSELCAREIIPAIRRGDIILLERFHPSTICYQGSEEGLSMEEVEELAGWTTPGLEPDLVVILDLDAGSALKRMGKDLDRFESKGTGYFEKVRSAFLEWASRNPNAVVVDASGGREKVAEAVYREVKHVLA